MGIKRKRYGADKRVFIRSAKLWMIAVVFVLAAILVGSGMVLERRSSDMPVTRTMLDALPLDNINKLMVVAHPDDETFWGGEHLAQEPYFVVCLTCGRDPVRRAEFEQAVKRTGGVPLILNYPDKELGIRSRWRGYLDDIGEDLSALLDYKDWECVVTHNPSGEYGHIHHMRTSSMVTALMGSHQDTELYYFGVYHTMRELGEMQEANELPERLPEELLAVKEEMVGLYASQEKIAGKFGHMFPYEEWYAAR